MYFQPAGKLSLAKNIQFTKNEFWIRTVINSDIIVKTLGLQNDTGIWNTIANEISFVVTKSKIFCS